MYYILLYNFQSLETVSQSALGLTTIAIFVYLHNIILYYVFNIYVVTLLHSITYNNRRHNVAISTY